MLPNWMQLQEQDRSRIASRKVTETNEARAGRLNTGGQKNGTSGRTKTVHDLPDTASTLQSGTSEESEETLSGSKEERRERERELTQIFFRRYSDAQQWQSHSYGSSTGTTTASLTDAKATLRRWGRWSRHSGVSNPGKELEETDRRHKKRALAAKLKWYKHDGKETNKALWFKE
jgi:hypothetical protein